LSERYQRVMIRGKVSLWGLIKAGVPQGSVLGPLLFLVYINDIVEHIKCNIKLFADDTTLYVSFDNQDTANNMLNEDLSKINDWSNQWLVTFSKRKTKAMTMSFKKFNPEPLTFNNDELEEVHQHKHLGLTFSNNLSWSPHISNIIGNVSKMSDVLKRLKYDLDRHTLDTIYKSFIRPKLEYASHIWDNCSKKDSDKLENFQLEIARTVSGARRGTSHQFIYSELGWETLSSRRQNVKLFNFHKMINKNAPNYLCNLIPKSQNVQYNLRNPIIPLPKTRTETFRKSFIPSTVNLWNNLTQEERDLTELDNFKKKLKPESSLNDLFLVGSRISNVKLAQLRMHCSKLNSHLHSLHVLDSPQCACGNDIEDIYHYFYDCPLFNNERHVFFQAIAHLNISHWDMLLFGNDNLEYRDNVVLIHAVQSFIENTGRL